MQCDGCGNKKGVQERKDRETVNYGVVYMCTQCHKGTNETRERDEGKIRCDVCGTMEGTKLVRSGDTRMQVCDKCFDSQEESEKLIDPLENNPKEDKKENPRCESCSTGDIKRGIKRRGGEKEEGKWTMCEECHKRTERWKEDDIEQKSKGKRKGRKSS